MTAHDASSGEGKIELPTVESLIAQGALFAISHSGGKDSQAMMIRLLKVVPAAQVVVVHACLGDVEWEGALDLAERQARDGGVPFIVARAVKTFFEMVEHRYKVRPGPNSPCWPSAANRQCTSDLKRGPIEREVRRYAAARGFTKVVSCQGVRAQESVSRSKLQQFRRNERNTISTRDWFDYLPIFALSTAEVFQTIADAGQEAHWAYADGNERISCVFCIFGSPRDIAHGARRRPELLARYIEVEGRTGYTMHMSRKPLLQIVAEGEAVLLANSARAA